MIVYFYRPKCVQSDWLGKTKHDRTITWFTCDTTAGRLWRSVTHLLSQRSADCSSAVTSQFRAVALPLLYNAILNYCRGFCGLYIFFKSENHNKTAYGTWKCNSKSFFWQRCSRRIDVWEFLSYTFIFRKQFHFVFNDLKIIGHRNPDNNLESLLHCRIVNENRSASSNFKTGDTQKTWGPHAVKGKVKVNLSMCLTN
jgi:hypothetical protein